MSTGKTDATICIVCLKAATQHLGQEPIGALGCVKCKDYSGMRIQYSNGSQAYWKFSGLDHEKKVVYTVRKTTGEWEAEKFPRKMFCLNCGTENPLDLVLLNDYVFKKPPVPV